MAKKGKGPPTVSRDSFPQHLGTGTGKRHMPGQKRGKGPPTVSRERFPQTDDTNDGAARHNPPG